MVRRLALAVLAGALGCAGAAARAPNAEGGPQVVLVSIDAFRWDYSSRYPTPSLDRLARSGVKARWMVPAFPTKTFPNHYSIVTGLYPAHHGIVSNNIVGSDGSRFRIGAPAALESHWWGGEPLWVTAERQGRRAMNFFWPGSDVEIAGVRSSLAMPYDGDVPDTVRVDSVLNWLSRPVAERPDFVTLYFSDVDHFGHTDGPRSTQVAGAIARVDSMIGRLLDGIARRGMAGRVNVIVVSDHGMIENARDRLVFLDDYTDARQVDVIDGGPFIALSPRDGDVARLWAAVRSMPHVSLYLRDSVPARWHYAGNPRIAPIVGVADDGWELTTHAWADGNATRYQGGDHGYDNASEGMRALFVAAGPAFRTGMTAPPFQNIHVYDLVCAILGLEPAPNDGSLDSVRVMLR